jgi:hypothetical protein
MSQKYFFFSLKFLTCVLLVDGLWLATEALALYRYAAAIFHADSDQLAVATDDIDLVSLLIYIFMQFINSFNFFNN